MSTQLYTTPIVQLQAEELNSRDELNAYLQEVGQDSTRAIRERPLKIFSHTRNSVTYVHNVFDALATEETLSAVEDDDRVNVRFRLFKLAKAARDWANFIQLTPDPPRR
jgi:hypothetical protein